MWRRLVALIRKVLVAMRSAHMHVEFVETVSRIYITGSFEFPKVSADFDHIEQQARNILATKNELFQRGFGPYHETEYSFALEHVFCSPLDNGPHKGRVFVVERLSNNVIPYKPKK